MDVTKIRMLNFLYLCDVKHTRGYVSEQLGYTDNNYLNQLCGGFGSFGNGVARKIEKALSLPHGWLDHLHIELYPDKVSREAWPLDTDQEYIDFFTSMSAEERTESMAYIKGMRAARKK